MILKGVKLKNIRSYANEEIIFPSGSVILSGDIGCGKSTILLAIEFALFGIMRSGLSGSTLLRHGTTNGSVELKFVIDKNEYVVKRTLRRSRSSVSQESGYILVNGRKFEGTPIELKAKILGILGYPTDLLTRSKSLIYRFTVYTAQEQMKNILFEDKEIRLDTLRKLFGIDKYKKIKENSILFIREIKKRSSELSIRLEQYDELENSKKDYEEKRKNLTYLVEEKNEQLKQTKNQISNQEKLTQQYEEEIKKFNEIKREIELKEMLILTKKNEKEKIEQKINDSSINEINKKIETYDNITKILPEKEVEEELEQNQEMYSLKIKEKSSLSKEKSMILENINNIKEKIKKATTDSKDSIILETKLDELKQRIIKKKEQESILEDLLKKDKTFSISLEKNKLVIEESKNLILSMNSQDFCPKCKQKITDEHKIKVLSDENSNIKEKEIENQKVREIISKINSNIKKVKNNLDKILEFEKQYQETKERLIQLQANSSKLVEKQKKVNELLIKQKQISEKLNYFNEDELKKLIDKIKENLTTIRDNNLKFREKKNLLEKIKIETKHNESLKQEIIKIDLLINNEKNELEKIKKSSKEFETLDEKYQEQKIILNDFKIKGQEIEIRLSALNQEYSSINEQIKLIDTKIETFKKTKEKIKNLNEIQNWFDSFFVKLMSTIEKHVMVSIHKEFNSLLKEWFAILIQDIDISLDDEFAVSLLQDGYEADIGSLSGGEKTSVALAYRLALNKVVNDLIPSINTKDLIILDEPTDGFSSEQLDKVRDVIEELNMKQTIIVSHEPKMESYVENIIRIAKSDGISRIV